MQLVAAKAREWHACLSTAAACLALLCAALAANWSAAELSCAFLAGALLVADESHAGCLRSQCHCQHPICLSVPDCSCYHLAAAVGAAAAVAAAVAVLGVVPAAETVAVTGTVAAALPAAVAAVSAGAAAAAVAEVGCQMEAWACQVAWQTRTPAQGTCDKHHTAHRHWNDPLACAHLWAAWSQLSKLMQGMRCQC